jgi:hypothetical protein
VTAPILAATAAPTGVSNANLGAAATNDDLISAATALSQADPAYQKAHAYYCGDISEVFASTRMRRAMLVTGIQFKFNFAKIPVDARSERIQISAATATPDTADTVLQDIWKRNKMNLQGRHFQRRALEYGDGYAMVWPDDDDESQVNICWNSPRSVRVFYDPEWPIKKKYAIKQWSVDKNTVRADLYYEDRIEKYVRIGNGSKARWLEWKDDSGDKWPYSNPYGEIPFFHFRTDDPYGRPVHQGFYGPQDAIHKLAISHMAGVDYQAFPQRYALTMPDVDTAEAGAADEDEFSFANDTGATSPDSEGRSQLQADPGSLWYLNGVHAVGQFETANPSNFTDPMLTYLRFGAQITNTPLHRIDPTGDQPSGESLRTAEAPFVKACEDLRSAFEDTWIELLTFALKVSGVAVAEIDIQWDPAQSMNDLEGWQTVQQKLDAGLPPRQAFAEAGYSAEQIDEWFPDNTDDLPNAIDLLLKIGQAFSALGTAISLGALSPEQMQAVVATLMGDPDGDGTPGFGLPPGPPAPPTPGTVPGDPAQDPTASQDDAPTDVPKAKPGA